MANIKQLDTTLLNHLTTEIIILDESLCILWINDSALANGWINDPKNQSSYSKFLCPKTEQEIKRIINMAIKDRKSVTKRDFELISNKKTSREVDLTVSFSPKFECIIIEVMSVDNLNKIIDSSKMASSQKIAANLARTLAHEVKNPLAGIRGAAQILEKNIESNEIVMTDLIINEVDRIKRLVDNLQVFDASIPIDLKPINIHSILRHVKDVMINSSEKKIKITEVFDPSIPDVIGNEDQLIQVFINLIKNSIEAFSNESDSDNEIILSTNYEHGFIVKEKLSEEKVKLPIKISVMDNGPGIPASISQEIFQPFVSTKKIGQGGLGLSIVSKIVSDHNGSIELDLTDQGTKFIIRLMSEL